ncbi:MAG: peptidase U32 family protein, partial [Slackia sp.]|nr:peptidase U32 family protein [Slackia sp.]
MMNPYRHMELLAPAGSMTCLHAAVAAGADAVYLGCDAFNARRSADNFTLDDLARACDFAHLRGVRVYLTLNIAIMPDEISAALELARQAWRRGVDALIVQDIGLAAEVRRALPDARLHISTQMNTHNIDGVRAAAEFGAERVTLARELSCAELAEVTEEAHSLNMETECFAHGALCICYSGQCLMSSMIGGRSANRGTCAQACRLPYTLCDEDSDAELSAPGDRLLSPKDLCTIDMLPKL